MDSLTPLMRAVLEALDTMDNGGDEFDIELGLVERAPSLRPHQDELERAIFALAFDELVREECREFDGAFRQYWHITDAGCEALWALRKAEARTFIGFDPAKPSSDQSFRPIYFENRAALRAYLAGGAA